jgi:hypothetical protein
MTLRPIMASLVLAIAMFIPASPAAAAVFEPDVVKLTDGRELEGTIVKEQNGYIWLDMGVGQPLFLSPDKIEEIIRDSDEPLPTEVVVEEEKGWERVPGVTRAAIITAEGTVGMQMASKPLREAIPMLKEEGVDLVVYKINSGGGLLLEIQQLSDVLHNEYKKDFQVVVWVESAISAAAMTGLTVENIYFMPKGGFGAATGWSGALQAMAGRGLEAVYYKMEKISARGNKDDKVIKAMQHNIELSYDVNEETGEVTFYQNQSGQHILNDGTDVLTLNSQQAEHCGFSAGTAGTYLELQALLEQSIGEIVWVGEKVEGIPYPVSVAEEHQIAYREEVDFQDARFGEVITKYNMELNNARGVAVDRRGGFIRRAEGYLARIKRMVKINPNFALLNLPEGWIEAQEEIIRELRRG